MSATRGIQSALERFAARVHEKVSVAVAGEPEEQLRAPFERFLADAAGALGWDVVSSGEVWLPGRLGRPDFGVHLNKLLAGYVELKAPGTGANPRRFSGRNREQWKRFQNLPNLLYSDGNEWTLCRGGEVVEAVRLRSDITLQGAQAVAPEDAGGLERLLREFFCWQPNIPTGRQGKIDLRGFAALLAPLCRLLREDVRDALQHPESPLLELAADWRQLLFPDASDEQFADAYAQTVAFALLLGRSEGADPLTLETAGGALAAGHSLLSRALQVLTDPGARRDIAASLDLLVRVIAAVPCAALTGGGDPWLYFYEDFLAAYDPELRKNAGAYYTPVQVVRCQVRLIDELLVQRLGKPLGFADAGVVTLDPAAGTGTYLLGVVEHALARIEEAQGPGAVPGQAATLAGNLYGFELMVGPYAVAELRVSRALADRGAALPPGGPHVYLTDTLESPDAEPPQLPLFLKPIADQHVRALKLKSSVPVIVCLGNPPYDRHEAAAADNRARTGGWVRWGSDGTGADAILRDFAGPALAAGHGKHLKNLYNLYVYFWRWALWKVFEQPGAPGPGIASFISASSYLDGDAFCGMREHMRRLCREIWILDLGGEGRGTRKSENVFAIQTPVAIAIALRTADTRPEEPAQVHYARIEGDRDSKLAALDGISGLASIDWEECSSGWRAPFRPEGKGKYFRWPLLTALMPRQLSGAQFKRTWPISPSRETLVRRWRALLRSADLAAAFKETRDRKVGIGYPSLTAPAKRETPLNRLPAGAPPPRVERYAYRSFDRQWILADSRLGDFLRPDLWRAHGERQIYLTSLLTKPLGTGPAVTGCSLVPDLDHFSGRGAKDVIPLYRDAAAGDANVLPGLLELLGKTYRRKVAAEDFAAYLYGILAHPAFTARFASQLETRQLRVPITKDAELFAKVCGVGARLLWLHTYGERFVPKGRQAGHVPPGTARCVKPVPGGAGGYPESFEYRDAARALRVGEGEFAPVEPAVFEFEVSGLKVVQSWLKYRMKRGGGKKSSPLDGIRPDEWTGEFTTELLELLWVLEATLKEYPEQRDLLNAVVQGSCFRAEELPAVAGETRGPASVSSGGNYVLFSTAEAGA